MKMLSRSVFLFVLLVSAIVFLPFGIAAQDVEGEAADEETAVSDGATEQVEEEIELTDEELWALLERVDRFFLDQDMANITVDVDIYRDPSRQLDERNIRSGDPSSIAGLSTVISHFTSRYPDFYELKVMGYVLAGSEMPEDRTFFSMMLPMPGAPIFTDEIRQRFYIRFDGVGEVEGRPAYRVRYSALDRETEFFDYIVYFIDIEREVILRVESAFDNVWYIGTGRGNYYYDEWLGKYLPIYGHGTVLFNPNRSFNVWGRWYRWDWETKEEAGISETTEGEVTAEDVAGESEEADDGATAGAEGESGEVGGGEESTNQSSG